MDSGLVSGITDPVKTGFFVYCGRWLFLLSGTLAACTGPSRLSSSPVIEVNQHVLTAQELAVQLARRLKNLDALTAKEPLAVNRAKDKILRDFVIQSVLTDYAQLNNLSVTEEQVDKEVNVVRANYPDDLSFRRLLAQEDLSLSEWRNSVRESLLTSVVFKKIGEKTSKPAESDIKNYFEDNKERYRRKERIFLRQIVLDDLTKAQAVHAEAAKSKDFSTLAKKYSVAPEAKEGGLVGWVEKGSVDIFDKAFQLPIGGVSPVLESSYGFHIFKVERKAAAGSVALEEVRPEIMSLLSAQKEQVEFIGWLDKQIRQTRVLRNTALIQAISVETKGKK